MVGTIIASCLGVLLAIAIIIFLVKKKGKQKEAQDVIKRIIPTPLEKINVQALLEKLLQTNTFIRITKTSDKVRQLVEGIIDDLRVVLPLMAEKYPDEELTYELRNIADRHLSKQLKEFFDMSADSQTEFQSGLIERLDEIKKLIVRARDIVERNEVSEFKMIASFLKTKYAAG